MEQSCKIRALLSLVKLKTLVLCVTFTLGDLRAALDGDIFCSFEKERFFFSD